MATQRGALVQLVAPTAAAVRNKFKKQMKINEYRIRNQGIIIKIQQTRHMFAELQCTSVPLGPLKKLVHVYVSGYVTQFGECLKK